MPTLPPVPVISESGMRVTIKPCTLPTAVIRSTLTYRNVSVNARSGKSRACCPRLKVAEVRSKKVQALMLVFMLSGDAHAMRRRLGPGNCVAGGGGLGGLGALLLYWISQKNRFTRGL
jgi:hypothetical protein